MCSYDLFYDLMFLVIVLNDLRRTSANANAPSDFSEPVRHFLQTMLVVVREELSNVCAKHMVVFH